MQLKKGIPLNQAFGAVLTLVLIGVLVIIGIFIFVNLRTTFNTTSASTINETGAYLNVTGYTLANANVCNFNAPVITEVWGNATVANKEYLIPAANYTVSTIGILTNATIGGGGLGLDDANVSYTYLWGGTACEATDTMIVQFGSYPVLVGLVGTIIFLGLVIGVLISSFAFGRREGV